MLVLVMLLVAAVAANAQTPMPFPVGECSVSDDTGGRVNEDEGAYQSKFKIPGGIGIVFNPGTLCETYARYGWEETMNLHLGEGASQYRKLIELAVQVWNETVNLPSGEPLIEIVDEQPKNYYLPDSFWTDTNTHGSVNLDDGQNVIYFKPSAERDGSPWGLAWSQSARGRMEDTDIYINTFDEESQPEYTLVLTKKLFDMPGNASYGAYITYRKTYSVILHEIGHAVGLKHIPVNGNVMSRDFGAGGVDQWSAGIAIDLLDVPFPSQEDYFVHLNSAVSSRYLRLSKRMEKWRGEAAFFTLRGKLGEQEKMALTCIYEY